MAQRNEIELKKNPPESSIYFSREGEFCYIIILFNFSKDTAWVGGCGLLAA